VSTTALSTPIVVVDPY